MPPIPHLYSTSVFGDNTAPFPASQDFALPPSNGVGPTVALPLPPSTEEAGDTANDFDVLTIPALTDAFPAASHEGPQVSTALTSSPPRAQSPHPERVRTVSCFCGNTTPHSTDLHCAFNTSHCSSGHALCLQAMLGAYVDGGPTEAGPTGWLYLCPTCQHRLEEQRDVRGYWLVVWSSYGALYQQPFLSLDPFHAPACSAAGHAAAERKEGGRHRLLPALDDAGARDDHGDQPMIAAQIALHAQPGPPAPRDPGTGWQPAVNALPEAGMQFDVDPREHFRSVGGGVRPALLFTLILLSRCLGQRQHPIGCRQCDRVCVCLLTGAWRICRAMEPPGGPTVDTMRLLRYRVRTHLESLHRGEKPTTSEQYVRFVRPLPIVDVTNAVQPAGAPTGVHQMPPAAQWSARLTVRLTVVRPLVLPTTAVQFAANHPHELSFRFEPTHHGALTAILNSGDVFIRIANIGGAGALKLCRDLWSVTLLECVTTP